MSFIGLVKGNPGSGKTFGAYSFPEPICHILLENRKDFYTQQKEIYYPGKLIDIKECYKTKQDGIFSTHDVLGSLQHLQSTFRSINLNQYQTIILDHAGRIRKWLIEEWCIRHHKKNVWPLDEYRVINANTRVYLAGLINAGKESDKNIILTTTYEDEYGTVEDDRGKKVPAKIGRAPEIKDFISADVNWILKFYINEQGRYTVDIEKSVVGRRVLDTHGKGTQLYSILQEQLKMR